MEVAVAAIASRCGPGAVEAAELFMSNICATAVRMCGSADACPVALFCGRPLMP